MTIPIPARVVVDTNVATTSNGINDSASPDCVAACGRSLQKVMASSTVFIDGADGLSRIVQEYRNKLHASGQPGPGDAFLKWILTNEWSGTRVVRVHITPKGEDDFEELPTADDGVFYDPSDRKFLAVAAAEPTRPTLLQALDSKWWGWRSSLERVGVSICFLCPDAIAKKYEEKMGRG